MSRIYDALQRAELERIATQEPEVIQDAGREVVSGIEKPPAAEDAVVLDNIARQPWKLSLSSFPTLAERGDVVEQFRSLRSRVQQARYVRLR